MRPHYSLISLLILHGCGKAPERPSATTTQATRIAVKATLLTQSQWPSSYEATGTVRAHTVAAVSSKLMGYARDVTAKIGDHVREGQLLVRLDTRDIDTSVNRAEAARDEVKSGVPEAESAIAAAKSQLDLAQATFQRMQDLHSKRSISNQEFDEANARLQQAKASHDMARARRTQLDAKLALTETEIRAAGINRTYTNITAPLSGVIVSKSIEPGTLAVPGAALFTIERDTSYRLEVSVEESRLPQMRVGMPLIVSIDGAGKTFNARIGEIVPSVDSTARAGTVKIDLPAISNLKSGLFGRAIFNGEPKQVLTVPVAAVVESGQLQTVFIAQNGVARLRLVTLGEKSKDQFEVLSGLRENERVIVPIPPNLTDGSPVEVQE